MSADNGIYIGKFPDGYRVTHAQAIENIDYYPHGSRKELEMIRNYFGKSQVFPTYEEARKAVRRLVTKLNGKYADSYSSFGFKVERV